MAFPPAAPAAAAPAAAKKPNRMAALTAALQRSAGVNQQAAPQPQAVLPMMPGMR